MESEIQYYVFGIGQGQLAANPNGRYLQIPFQDIPSIEVRQGMDFVSPVECETNKSKLSLEQERSNHIYRYSLTCLRIGRTARLKK